MFCSLVLVPFFTSIMDLICMSSWFHLIILPPSDCYRGLSSSVVLHKCFSLFSMQFFFFFFVLLWDMILIYYYTWYSIASNTTWLCRTMVCFNTYTFYLPMFFKHLTSNVIPMHDTIFEAFEPHNDIGKIEKNCESWNTFDLFVLCYVVY